MPSATVAVILPTYNRARYVREAIDSVLRLLEPPDEVIVVDDGSTDDTQAVLAGYGDAIRVVTKENGGASSARNAGAAVATADWLTFLDSDDLWLPQRMAILRQDLAEAPAGVVAHVSNVVFKGVGADRDMFSGKRIRVAPGDVALVERPLAMFLHAFFLGGAALRRDVFARLGGFDTSFPTDEDTDLAHRFADQGAFLVRGDIVAEIIRRPEDGAAALSVLRREDPFLASDLKLRQFRAILDRARDPGERDLVGAALSSALLQRAGLIRRTGGRGYWRALLSSAQAHPSPIKGYGKALREIVMKPQGPRTLDRTAGQG
jgi:glycosyltransferase involved in cell wall biosynthesis